MFEKSEYGYMPPETNRVDNLEVAEVKEDFIKQFNAKYKHEMFFADTGYAPAVVLIKMGDFRNELENYVRDKLFSGEIVKVRGLYYKQNDK